MNADVILHSLLEVLQRKDVQQHFTRENPTVPKQSSRKTKEKNKRRRFKMIKEVLKQHGVVLPPASAFASADKSTGKKASEPTPFLCGINSITRHLETQIRTSLTRSDEASSSSMGLHDPTYIFVCLSDIDPPALVSHFPLLVATYNAVLKKQCTLICLPEGSEKQLTEAINLRRCSCISIDPSSLDGLKTFSKKIRDADQTPIRLEWLEKAVESLQTNGPQEIDLVEPQIKHLRSSAPLDMNAVKIKRKEERIERKATRRNEKGKKLKSSTALNAVAVKKPVKLTKLQKLQNKAKRQLKNAKKSAAPRGIQRKGYKKQKLK